MYVKNLKSVLIVFIGIANCKDGLVARQVERAQPQLILAKDNKTVATIFDIHVIFNLFWEKTWSLINTHEL